MDSGEGDFLEPRGRPRDRSASRISAIGTLLGRPGRRNDAVRARLRAPGLDAQRERRSAGDARFDRCSAAAFAVAEALRRRETEIVASSADQRDLSSLGTTRSDVGQRREILRDGGSRSSL